MSESPLNISEPNVPWGQLVEFVDAPNRTVRTWKNKYFSDLGEKQKNSRLLFSVLDCIVINIFSTLVRKLSMQVDMAVEIAISSRDYLIEKATSDDFIQSKATYFVISDTGSVESKYQVMDQEGLKLHAEETSINPYTVIPIDFTRFLLVMSASKLTSTITKATESIRHISDENYIETMSDKVDEMLLETESLKRALKREIARTEKDRK